MPILPFDAERANRAGYGIFWSYNSFAGRRIIQNLKKINAWAVDLDGENKENQIKLIKHGLVPSAIIESKNGYHVYFEATNAKPHHWYAIMQDRLIPFYNADRRAKDITRLLRAPGYYHMKNPEQPFYVDYVFKNKVQYSEEDIAYFYPDASEDRRKEYAKKQAVDSGEESTSFWEAVWRLDSQEALTKISGHDSVNKEVYSFKQNSNGKLNILVNGNSTSCFIDKEGKIGSFDGGGPGIAQWLKWFGHPWRNVVLIIKEVFPETRGL